MIDHTGFNVTNLELSRAFYLKALAPLGYGIALELEGAAGFGAREGAGDDPGGDFWISVGEPQTPRTHVAFRAANEEQVDEFYWAAIEAGGKDNGPPGPRPHYHEGYYAAFVLDPDGHNIEAVYHGGSRAG
ncbi:MAG: VOC family protein [Gaiellaceae bacterium]|jgi:catechol 2,3-dioxygenase-like lactoylglutathione lyase family enzyme